MIGSLFAGADESPGKRVLYQGRSYKVYRGMGSLGAMSQGSADRYGQAAPANGSDGGGAEAESGRLVPEGVEGRVPYRGPMADNVHQPTGGVAAGMGYCGCRTLPEAAGERPLLPDHGGGPAREPRPRHRGHAGGPQLPAGMTDA